jgi:hypothetical protein
MARYDQRGDQSCHVQTESDTADLATCLVGARQNEGFGAPWIAARLARRLLEPGGLRASADLGGQPTRRALKGAPLANIKESLAKIMQLDGALGTCVVDSNSGMMLGASSGPGSVNLEVAAAGNTEVVRAKRKTMKALNLRDQIEDILITLHSQYHLIRPLGSNDALFIYLVLDKKRGNLAMSRHQLAAIEKELAL